MATAQANAAAPLDQLLVDVGAGPLRRWLPGRPGVEFIASLASKPCKVGRRLSIMVGDRTLLLAACSGSIITSMLIGHPAVRGRLNRIAGLGLLVTVLDQAKAGLPAACVSKAMLCRAAASSVRKGYLDGPTLAELFASRRPGDLIWNYWVNNKAEAQRIRSLNKQVLARASAARTGAVDGYEKPCRTWPTSKPRSRAAASLTGCKLPPTRTPNS